MVSAAKAVVGAVAIVVSSFLVYLIITWVKVGYKAGVDDIVHKLSVLQLI
jgi:hypothetical protein